MSCGVGPRRDSDPVLLWLWHRLATTALIGPLAWKSPYTTSEALKSKKKKKRKKKVLPMLLPKMTKNKKKEENKFYWGKNRSLEKPVRRSLQ